MADLDPGDFRRPAAALMMLAVIAAAAPFASPVLAFRAPVQLPLLAVPQAGNVRAEHALLLAAPAFTHTPCLFPHHSHSIVRVSRIPQFLSLPSMSREVNLQVPQTA